MCNNNNVVPSMFIPRSAAKMSSCLVRMDGGKLVLRFDFRCASHGHTGLDRCSGRRSLLGCLHRRDVIRRFMHFTSSGKMGQHGLLVRGSCGLLREDLCNGVVCGVLKERRCVHCVGRDSTAIGGTLSVLRHNRTFPGTPRTAPVVRSGGSSKGRGEATRTNDFIRSPARLFHCTSIY